MINKKPLVSIICFAYNHEKFIKDAIEGFLIQKTTFPFEIIIHDDASTDCTPNIIKEYEQNNPELFKPIYQKENQASKEKGRVSKICFNAVRGEYIALCEGDDYWTDPLKLQKQVDFLEANPAYSMCGAQAKCLVINQDNQEFSGGFLTNKKEVLTTLDFLSGYPMHTSTVLLRKSMLQMPDWLTNVKNGDVTLFSLLSENGPAFFMNKPVSVYRVTGTGVWSSASIETRYYAFKNTVNYLNKHFNGKYKTAQLRWEYNEAKKVSQMYWNEKQYGMYLKFIFKNYHRYFWRFIWLPKQKEIIGNVTQTIVSFWVKFRMFVGLRTRIRKLKGHFSKKA